MERERRDLGPKRPLPTFGTPAIAAPYATARFPIEQNVVHNYQILLDVKLSKLTEEGASPPLCHSEIRRECEPARSLKLPKLIEKMRAIARFAGAPGRPGRREKLTNTVHFRGSVPHNKGKFEISGEISGPVGWPLAEPR